MIRQGQAGEYNDINPKGNNEIEDRIRKKLHFAHGCLGSWSAAHEKLSSMIADGDIYTSVNTSYLFDARDGKLDTDLLFLVAAVKSIIGFKRNFAKSNRDTIVTRMYGGSPDKLKRYAFIKLFDTATAKRMCTRIPAGRGFFISIRYDTNALGEAVYDRKEKYLQHKLDQAQWAHDIGSMEKGLKAQIKRSTKVSTEY